MVLRICDHIPYTIYYCFLLARSCADSTRECLESFVMRRVVSRWWWCGAVGSFAGLLRFFCFVIYRYFMGEQAKIVCILLCTRKSCHPTPPPRPSSSSRNPYSTLLAGYLSYLWCGLVAWGNIMCSLGDYAGTGSLLIVYESIVPVLLAWGAGVQKRKEGRLSKFIVRVQSPFSSSTVT